MQLIDFHTHRKTAEGVITPRSFGIHPWDADDEKTEDYSQFASLYGDYFADAEIIGECGLDKASSHLDSRSPASNTSWDRQRKLFLWQTELAAKLHKPMVIHCVRAFNEVIEMRRSLLSRHKAVATWVIHGFIGNKQMAEQLFRSGIWVSFGAAITDPRREKVRQCLAAIETPFLLETDESECGIEAIYAAAAEIKRCDIEQLSDTIIANYSALFEH